MICTVYVITGLFGPDIWDVELFTLNLTSLGYGNYQINSSIIYVVLGLGSLYFNIISAMQNVAKHYEAKDGEDSKSRNLKLVKLIKGYIPFSFTMELSFCIVGSIRQLFRNLDYL